MAGLRRRSVGQGVVDDARDLQEASEEAARVEDVARRRLYYEGRQYEARNQETADATQCASIEELPEHEKLLAYSTQIAECVDFLASRLGEGFAIKAADTAVQDVITAAVAASDTISAEDATGERAAVTDDLLVEAFQTGDVAVYVGWDPIEQTTFMEFWESENVQFSTVTTREIGKVIRTETVWRMDPLTNETREVEERVEYTMEVNPAGAMECIAKTFWDDEAEQRDFEWLGVGRIPWALLRAEKKRLRTFRGEPLISRQVMQVADRYNAIEQVAYLIARYNSHGNMVVLGDGAEIGAMKGEKVHKDVADILTFPSGTQAVAITLPTDPQMIEHQRGVLAESIYQVFGLTRVEPDTLSGLGGVSGYALEILNQKSEATFKRIARRWRTDWVSLIGLLLDVQAWKDSPVVSLDVASGVITVVSTDTPLEDLIEVPGETMLLQGFWLVDPQVVYPNRKVEIEMGSGYIVDAVMIRDDFVANLISREEALRKRGLTQPEIDQILGEIEAAAPAVPEVGQFTAAGVPPVSGTTAGSTVGALA